VKKYGDYQIRSHRTVVNEERREREARAREEKVS